MNFNTSLTLVIATVALMLFMVYRLNRSNKYGLPRAGDPGAFGWMKCAFQHFVDPSAVISEGREKFSGHPFILPSFFGSQVVVGPEIVDFLRTSSDSIVRLQPHPLKITPAHCSHRLK